MDLIVELHKGVSMQSAYIPRNTLERDMISNIYKCANCNKVDYVTGDKGPLRKMEDIKYYIVALKCKCGFFNRVYVIVNNLEPSHTNKALDINFTLEDMENKGKISTVEVDLLLLNAAVAGFRSDYDLAMKYIKKCLSITESNAAVWYNYAFLLTKENKQTEALEAYTKSLECDPEFYSAYFHMAIIYEFTGNLADAKKCLDLFLNKYPNYMPAKNFLQKINKNADNPNNVSSELR